MERHRKPLPARGPAQAGRSGPRCHPAALFQRPNGAGSVEGIRRFILFHGKRHLKERGVVHVEALLTPSRGQEQRRVLHPKPCAERYRAPLPADIEKAIRLAGGYRSRQEAGRATARVHARRRASGLGALEQGPIRNGEALVRLRVAAHGVRQLRLSDVDSDQDPLQRFRFRLRAPL
jgi:hypothetical protein